MQRLRSTWFPGWVALLSVVLSFGGGMWPAARGWCLNSQACLNEQQAYTPTFGNGGCGAGTWFLSSANGGGSFASQGALGGCASVWISQEVWVTEADTGFTFGDTGPQFESFACTYDDCYTDYYQAYLATSTAGCVASSGKSYYTNYQFGFANNGCGHGALQYGTITSTPVTLP